MIRLLCDIYFSLLLPVIRILQHFLYVCTRVSMNAINIQLCAYSPCKYFIRNITSVHYNNVVINKLSTSYQHDEVTGSCCPII